MNMRFSAQKSNVIKVHIELLRIVACFLVLFNHSFGAMSTFSLDDFSKSRVAAMSLYFICRSAVPIFIMIMGANLLTKKDSFSKWIKRLVKCVFLIVITALIYHVYENQAFSLKMIIINIVTAKISTASWYLYLYLGVIIILPILQSVQISNKLLLYGFVIYLIGPGLFPVFQYHFGILNVPYIFEAQFPWVIIILLMGYYMENVLSDSHYNWKGAIAAVLILTITIFFSIACAVHHMKWRGTFTVSEFYSGLSFPTPTLLIAISLFYLSKYCEKRYSSTITDKIICVVGNYTLFIYIVGDLLRDIFEFVYDYLKSNISEIIAIVIYDLVVMGVGIVMAFLFYEVILRGVKLLLTGWKRNPGNIG